MSLSSKLRVLSALALLSLVDAQTQSCRNAPGDPGFPTLQAWNALNASISGRLAAVVPSGQFCKDRGGCTDAEWVSSVFRNEIPGAMNKINWEHNYEASPPEICLRNTTGTCAQGDVPLYAVLATSAADVQAGVAFASSYNLRIVIKASGHDFLGRSSARDSLLISTHHLQDAVFEEDFAVGGVSKGSVVTVGSGMPLNTFYTAAKAAGKIVVGGTAATVVGAGGYVQGAGHSGLSPLFGLASDNAHEFSIVTADGELVTANEDENSDLFWALRGGGAGSWGVIISVTFSTYPTYNATWSFVTLNLTGTPSSLGNLMAIHAKHVPDLDAYRAGQYFYANRNATTPETMILQLSTYFSSSTPEEAETILKPVLDEMMAVVDGTAQIVSAVYNEVVINDGVWNRDDVVPLGNLNMFMGSRLIPESAYTDAPEKIGTMYEKLLEAGTNVILGHLVAGGKVAENAAIDSAVHPGWRTAKTHLIIHNFYDDGVSLDGIAEVRDLFQKVQLPIIEEVTGQGTASYSNEADYLEPNWKTTFYGPNYDKLLEIKQKYDPDGLFIVAAGVGSDEWDADAFCKVV